MSMRRSTRSRPEFSYVFTTLNWTKRRYVALSLNDRNLDLIEEGIDVAVRIGNLPDSNLIARQVGSVRRVAVASPRYIAARGTPRVPADLAKHDTIFGMALPVQLVTLSRIHMTPKVRAFIDTAVKVLREVEVIQ
jgi:DNA-binding transcriptional LysR family regulator